MADAFPDGSCQLIVSPGAGASFGVGSDIRGDDATWKVLEPHHLTDAFATRRHRPAMLTPVVHGVASGASRCRSEQIPAPFQPRGRALELARRKGTRPGAKDRPPSDSETYSDR